MEDDDERSLFEELGLPGNYLEAMTARLKQLAPPVAQTRTVTVLAKGPVQSSRPATLAPVTPETTQGVSSRGSLDVGATLRTKPLPHQRAAEQVPAALSGVGLKRKRPLEGPPLAGAAAIFDVASSEACPAAAGKVAASLPTRASAAAPADAGARAASAPGLAAGAVEEELYLDYGDGDDELAAGGSGSSAAAGVAGLAAGSLWGAVGAGAAASPSHRSGVSMGGGDGDAGSDSEYEELSEAAEAEGVDAAGVHASGCAASDAGVGGEPGGVVSNALPSLLQRRSADPVASRLGAAAAATAPRSAGPPLQRGGVLVVGCAAAAMLARHQQHGAGVGAGSCGPDVGSTAEGAAAAGSGTSRRQRLLQALRGVAAAAAPATAAPVRRGEGETSGDRDSASAAPAAKRARTGEAEDAWAGAGAGAAARGSGFGSSAMGSSSGAMQEGAQAALPCEVYGGSRSSGMEASALISEAAAAEAAAAALEGAAALPPALCPAAVVDLISARLQEPNTCALHIAVVELPGGAAQALELLQRTEAIEAAGGMATADGNRRRTPGGVFFALLRECVDREAYKRVLAPQSAAHNAAKNARRRAADSTWREAILPGHRSSAAAGRGASVGGRRF